jgi:C-terminal processing protease CtpA/Prc
MAREDRMEREQISRARDTQAVTIARVQRMVMAILALSLAACRGGPGSVGAVLGRDNETRALYVRDAPEGLAAGRAGLQAGDEIVMIEGRYVKDMDAGEIRSKLRGEVGSAVRLTVVRGGTRVLHVRVERAPMGERRAPPPREERIAE